VTEQTAALIELLDRWQTRRVVVAGDFMLDKYAYGNADRLSPDAPVPVLGIEAEQPVPGGAANVAQNLQALSCDVALVGVTGDDAAGHQLRESLDEAGCDITGLIHAADRPTTVKHNFVGLAQHRHPQKMFRVDVEEAGPLTEPVAAAVLERASDFLAEAEVLCLEDYGKGVLDQAMCQRLIKLARQMNVPVLVDPAGSGPFDKYAGASCLTPNRTEAARALGATADMSPEELARGLAEWLNPAALVLTRDKHGALLQEAGREPMRLPTVARSVYDVTGAGDAVLAMLAAAKANGADWPQAVALANVAAGLAVAQFGLAPISQQQVLVALLQQHHAELGKRRTVAQLQAELAAYRQQGERIAFTNGCFDILHAGHVQFLRQARQQADLLVVGVNSDDSIRRIKGEGRPVNELEDRLMVLSELASVDYLVVFEEDTPGQLIEAVAPDVLVKGADYQKEQIVGSAFVESRGGSVVLVDLIEGRSTSNIISRVKG